MALTLLQMRQIMRRALGVDANDDGFDDSGCNQKLNLSWWDFMTRMDIREDEVTIPFTALAGTRKYAVPGDMYALRSIDVFDQAGPIGSNQDYQSHNLEQMSLQRYGQLYISDSTSPPAAQAMPTNYIRESNFIYLWPTPDLAYDLVFHYWKVLQDLASDTDILPVPENQHQIILLGGISNGYLELGDLTRYSENEGIRDKKISELVPVQAEEESDNRMAHVEVPGREYP